MDFARCTEASHLETNSKMEEMRVDFARCKASHLETNSKMEEMRVDFVRCMEASHLETNSKMESKLHKIN